MSKESIEKKEVYLDFEGAIAIFKSRGVNKNFNDISQETGFTRRGIEMLRKSGPKAVKMVYHFLKDNDLKFEDLVKEVGGKECNHIFSEEISDPEKNVKILE